jgi:hypothetical protein
MLAEYAISYPRRGYGMNLSGSGATRRCLISHCLHPASVVFPVCNHIMSPAKVSPLRQLADIVSSSVDKIDAHFDALGLDYPSLDIPWDPTSPSELASMSPEVVQASMLVVSACAQLSATVHNPSLTLFDAGAGVGYFFPRPL